MSDTKRVPQALLIMVAFIFAVLVALDVRAGTMRRAARDMAMGAVVLVAATRPGGARGPSDR